jgi:hypothetical protein
VLRLSELVFTRNENRTDHINAAARRSRAQGLGIVIKIAARQQGIGSRQNVNIPHFTWGIRFLSGEVGAFLEDVFTNGFDYDGKRDPIGRNVINLPGVALRL